MDAAVVLLAEDVDRNFRFNARSLYNYVVLLAEDVDRNATNLSFPSLSRVVLLAEDVDRNKRGIILLIYIAVSSSSRRTWIEIPPLTPDRRLP